MRWRRGCGRRRSETPGSTGARHRRHATWAGWSGSPRACRYWSRPARFLPVAAFRMTACTSSARTERCPIFRPRSATSWTRSCSPAAARTSTSVPAAGVAAAVALGGGSAGGQGGPPRDRVARLGAGGAVVPAVARRLGLPERPRAHGLDGVAGVENDTLGPGLRAASLPPLCGSGSARPARLPRDSSFRRQDASTRGSAALGTQVRVLRSTSRTSASVAFTVVEARYVEPHGTTAAANAENGVPVPRGRRHRRQSSR